MIRFSLNRIPVTVRPSFWLVAVLLGYSLGRPLLVAIWVAIVFVSVLVHELGHATVARMFGASVSIQLTTFGGLTAWSMPASEMTPGRRALVAASGSAVGILGGLAVWAGYVLIRPTGSTLAFIVTNVIWVNVGWGILNWLPIRPLDGGHLLESVLDMTGAKGSGRIADVIFLVTSAGALAAALYFGLVFVAVLAGFMTWSEISRHIGRQAPTQAAAPFVFSYEELAAPEPKVDALPPGEDTAGELEPDEDGAG